MAGCSSHLPALPHSANKGPVCQGSRVDFLKGGVVVRPPREHPSWQVAQLRAALAHFPVEEPQACVRKKTPPCSHLQWGDRGLPALLPKSLPGSTATPTIPQCQFSQKGELRGTKTVPRTGCPCRYERWLKWMGSCLLQASIRLRVSDLLKAINPGEDPGWKLKQPEAQAPHFGPMPHSPSCTLSLQDSAQGLVVPRKKTSDGPACTTS